MSGIKALFLEEKIGEVGEKMARRRKKGLLVCWGNGVKPI